MKKIRYTHIPDFTSHKKFIEHVELERERSFGGGETEQTNTVYKGTDPSGKEVFVLCTINWVRQGIAGFTVYKPFTWAYTYHNSIATILPYFK